MAAILRDSAVIVVRTCQRARPLAMITRRKSMHGFPLLFYEYGAPLGGPKLRCNRPPWLGVLRRFVFPLQVTWYSLRNCSFIHLKIIHLYTCDNVKIWKREFSRASLGQGKKVYYFYVSVWESIFLDIWVDASNLTTTVLTGFLDNWN